MSRRYRYVIVGAGVMGLATAYELARRGETSVLVVDRGYLCGGASGRNGGGVRAQFSSETNIRLMQESIALCREFASRFRINVWFRQGGYLFLTRDEARAKELAASARLQNDCGLPTRLLSPAEAKRVVPELDPAGVVLASFNPRDGVVFPWPFVWGYARAAQELGVTLATFRAVTAVETQGDRVRAVRLRRTRHAQLARLERRAPTGAGARERPRDDEREGPSARGEPDPALAFPLDEGASEGDERVECDELVCCAGAWSPSLARLVGVELPNHPHRHEICSTEPLKPWLGPLVADLTDGLYFSQSARGEIVGGVGVSPVPPGVNQRSSARFLATYARSLVRAVPRLAGVKVLRQWAGCYDLTPDGNPLVGRLDEVPNFTLACGFMGHGFMMAPVVGQRLAGYLTHTADEATQALFARWALRRYREGKLLSESMIIG